MTAITKSELSKDTLAKLMLKGDLSGLTEAQLLQYYAVKCDHVGLDKSELPFEYIKLNGRVVLYATKKCAEQLRKKHGLSIYNLRSEVEDEILTVTVDAKLPDGRTDTDMGSVSISGLKREALANAKLKAVTKAKRRVTLSILGLGMLAEEEVNDIPGAEPVFTPSKLRELPQKAEERHTFKDTIITKADQLGFEQDVEQSTPKPRNEELDYVAQVKSCKTQRGADFWVITFENNETEYSTFNKQHVDVASSLRQSGAGCTFTSKQNGKYNNLTTIQPV